MQVVGRSAIELAGAVRDGRIGAREVVAAHLEHLADVEPRLGAYVTVRRQAALAEAERLDADGDVAGLPLAGVPVAIKDVVDVAGEPTRHGSTATDPSPAREDHEVVARLRAAGAIVVGKTRGPELSVWGTSDDADGTAVSPWDPSRSAGGSSGGSGAAVAAGTVPIALGTDGLGSVRYPAAANGCVGIKPGAGMLAEVVDGRHHWFGMSRIGPIASTVADAALMLDVMAGSDRLRRVEVPTAPLRVAVSWVAPVTGTRVHRDWIEAALEAGRLLRRAGHDVQRADPPRPTPQDALAIIARWTQGVADDVASLGLELAALQPRTRGHAAAGARLARSLPVADDQAQRWRDRVEPFLDEYDVLITPMFARTQPAARAWHRASWAANLASNAACFPFAPVWNLADVPAAAVPVWHDGGRPLSVQVVAAADREATVLSVAADLEQQSPWTRHAPGWGVATSAE